MEELTQERLEKYLDVTKRALDKVKITDGRIDSWEKHARDFFDMAQRYYKDALHFRKEGREMDAFAAVNYAHGWLDAGARVGFFDVAHDNKLFTVD
ncbi:MAG: DUF357 domain-containing protein [Candidatus Nanoarchaeia archaeon]